MEDIKTSYLSLAQLADRSGEAISCAGNLPLDLHDPNSIWFVDRGAVNLFLIEVEEGTEQAAPQYLLHRKSGTIFPGVAPDEIVHGSTLRLIAKGLPDTLLKRIPVALLSEVDPAELAGQFDNWLIDLTDTLARFASYLPRPTSLAEPDLSQTFTPGILSVLKDVVWVSVPPSGSSLFMDMIDNAESSDSGGRTKLIPLTWSAWLTLLDEVTLTCKSTKSLVQEGELFAALSTFHVVVFGLERINRRLALVDEANLDRARTASRRSAEQAARKRLFNIYDLPDEEDSDVENRALMAALEFIGRQQGIEFKFPERGRSSESPVGLTDILDASGVRARRIDLDASSNWWKHDNGAILAFNAETSRPVALLPSIWGRYREIDPVSKRSVRLTSSRAEGLLDEAWAFYRPLPSRPVTLVDLLSIALHGTFPDSLRLVLAGLPAGLIKLVPALVLGFVANHIAADGDESVLYMVAVTLVAFGVLGAILHLFQNDALMRLEGRVASRLEAAFWDRLMRLPSKLLHRRPAGDLALSGMTFQNLRDGFQSLVADSILSTIFLLPVLGVIFFYDRTLGFVALCFSVVSMSATVGLGLLQISPYTTMIGAVRRVTGRLFQIVGGIAKLRMENAEGSAFDMWAQDYREQKKAELEQGKWESHAQAFGAALPFLAAGVLLYAVVNSGDRDTPIGDFLVVYSVFITFQLAVARLGESFGAIASILPAFDQMRPLLAADPEPEFEGESVEFLAGDVLFDRISFRYDQDGPLILDDVTIRARPGEFIAIAGESGAGKSTLFRLALGLDQPTAGAVYYDGRDLRHLNLKQLRRKIGAVPQSVGLHPQDLWDNLVSHHQQISSDDVWQAVRVAEVEDEIKRMPMGLMTMVGNTSSVLSGGESQRVTIARSVIGNPRIMFFDEATNWLDNESQAKVMQNLTSLTSTRIVIAHRLSTLEQADRIYVLQAGKIAQSGTFRELIKVEGVFKDLVRRQVV